MISSGKYRGMTCWFRSIPIVVFSNSYPNLTSLSSDRYDIVTIGIDLYFPRDEEAIYAFEPTIPFVQIAEVPNLREEFSLRQFIIDLWKNQDDNNPVAATEQPSALRSNNADIRNRVHTGFSQVVGPSTAAIVQNLVSNETSQSSPQHGAIRPFQCPHNLIGANTKDCPCRRKSSTNQQQDPNLNCPVPLLDSTTRYAIEYSPILRTRKPLPNVNIYEDISESDKDFVNYLSR